MDPYQFNQHAVPVFLAAFLVLGFGIVLWIKKRGDDVTTHFVVLSGAIFFWLFCTAMGYMATSAKLAYQWFCFDNAGVMFISPSFFAFSATLVGSKKRNGTLIGYSVASLFALGAIFGLLPLYGVKHFFWGYFPQWSVKRSLPVFLFFFGYMSWAFTILTQALGSTKSYKEKNQIRYVLVAFGIAYFGSVDYLATFGRAVYPFGFVAILCLVAVLFYAVVKHNLMNITVIIRQTIVYSVVTGTLTAVYLGIIVIFAHLFEGLSGYQTIFSSAIAAGLITVFFQPLRKRVQTVVDIKFFRQYVDREEKLYELSRDVITHTTPEAMGNALRQVLMETFHPKSGALFVRSRDGNGFAAASQWGALASGPLSEESPMVRYFLKRSQPFLLDLSGSAGESRDTRDSDVRGRNA